jgi:hypothetical protein
VIPTLVALTVATCGDLEVAGGVNNVPLVSVGNFPVLAIARRIEMVRNT